jgi:hypothetical protein
MKQPVRIPPGESVIRGACLMHCALFVYGGKRIDESVTLGDPIQAMGRRFSGA